MKLSRRREIEENTYLIEKYGLQSVQTLIDYLEDQYCNGTEVVDLKKAQKLQDQIKYLKGQRSRHFTNKKIAIIDQIMESLEEEKANILKEFEEQRKANMRQIVEEAQQIQIQLQNQQTYEMNKLDDELERNYDSFVNKKSQRIIDLTYKLEQLCMRQEYKQAEFIRQALQEQTNKFYARKHNEWKDHRDNQIKTLKLKHQKQRNSLRIRLQAVVNEEIESKAREFQKLVKKIDIHQDKIYKNLTKQTKYQKQISGLTNSRYQSRQSRSLSRTDDYVPKSVEKAEPETGPTSQAHTDRLNYQNDK